MKEYLEECNECEKLEEFAYEFAECVDCGNPVCDKCLVMGYEIPGWRNGDFHCPRCERARKRTGLTIT